MLKSTKDYTIFKKNPQNRDIDRANLNAIIRSLEIKNLLQFRPILVDAKMMVIDGQHRLEAAKALSLEIWYEVNKESESEDIYLLNANQKVWKNSDFLNFYVNAGKDDYIKFKNFMVKYGLDFRRCFCLLSGGSKKMKSYTEFNKGNFKFPPDDRVLQSISVLKNINQFVEFICEKTPAYKSLSTTILQRALIYFFNLYNVDFNLFMSKLEFKLNIFHRCSTIEDYIKIFIEIYNWKNREPINSDPAIYK